MARGRNIEVKLWPWWMAISRHVEMTSMAIPIQHEQTLSATLACLSQDFNPLSLCLNRFLWDSGFVVFESFAFIRFFLQEEEKGD